MILLKNNLLFIWMCAGACGKDIFKRIPDENKIKLKSTKENMKKNRNAKWKICIRYYGEREKFSANL